jgi:hypothetical protein
MEHACYRCGSRVEEQTPFCPACGAAQIRVSAREPQALEAQDLAHSPPQPESSESSRSSEGPLGLDASHRIQWKSFFRTALPLAAVAGFFTAYGSPLGIILFPASVVLAAYIYRRRQPGALAAWQGAKMGAFMGLLSSVFFALVLAAEYVADAPAFRQAMVMNGQEIVAHSLTPESQQMAQSWFSGAHAVAVITALLVVSTLVSLLAIGAVSGTLAAAFFGKNRTN